MGSATGWNLYEYSERPGAAMQTSQTLQEIVMSGMSAQFVRFFLGLTKSSLVDGRQAVYEGVIEALKGLEPEAGHEFLRSAMDILGTSDRAVHL